MKELRLPHGEVAWVDDEDYEAVERRFRGEFARSS